ncbi:hypothetical protein J1N35_037545 [Gossypium stocksii]|uniref:RNase H type-1 domain-containing protein n=1 Tax=Gossypium stocksii TaxID=47602 RepID=A0A9D3UJV7_9ROSI|nr:hypothetical protein J1N35_037545 [Gossypium stocksii]
MSWVWSDRVLQMGFMEWITWFFEHNSNSSCKVFMSTMWTIWSECNKWVHEGKKRAGLDIANFICQFIRKLEELQRVLLDRKRSLVHWSSLVYPHVKINFDAAFRESKNRLGSGIVIRDNEG